MSNIGLSPGSEPTNGVAKVEPTRLNHYAMGLAPYKWYLNPGVHDVYMVIKGTCMGEITLGGYHKRREESLGLSMQSTTLKRAGTDRNASKVVKEEAYFMQHRRKYGKRSK